MERDPRRKGKASLSIPDQLIDLQHLDLEFEQLNKQAESLRAAVTDDHEVRGLTSLHNATVQRVKDHQLRSRELEREIDADLAKIKSEEAKLYSTNIKTSKDADAVQKEIAYRKSRQREHEDLVLVEMEELERHTADRDRIATELASATAKHAKNVGEWSGHLSEIEAKIQTLHADREKRVGAISPEAFRQYERLRERKGGIAIAQLQGSMCGACRMTIPLNQIQKARLGMLLCDNCGRILYVGH